MVSGAGRIVTGRSLAALAGARPRRPGRADRRCRAAAAIGSPCPPARRSAHNSRSSARRSRRPDRRFRGRSGWPATPRGPRLPVRPACAASRGPGPSPTPLPAAARRGIAPRQGDHWPPPARLAAGAPRRLRRPAATPRTRPPPGLPGRGGGLDLLQHRDPRDERGLDGALVHLAITVDIEHTCDATGGGDKYRRRKS